jgi:hypothetical protein
MTLIDYPAKSLEIQSRLAWLGLPAERLMLIGAFVVAYGLFETTLERALWTLSETSVAGVRPFTETMNSESQFKMLGQGNAKLSAECNAVLQTAALAAEDLNEYRNSLVHGYLVSFGNYKTPWFMKNPAWYDVKRNKQVGDAFVDEPFQDLVLIAAWTLVGVVRLVETVFSKPESEQAIANMKRDVEKARNYASEVRHQRVIANMEKN